MRRQNDEAVKRLAPGGLLVSGVRRGEAMMREWLRRLWMTGRRRERHQDLEAELSFHIEMRERALVDEGVPPAEAARRARLDVGNRALVHEDSRDAWMGRHWRTVRQDLGLGWRSLWRSPAASLSLVGTLALGVGANVAIFSVIDAALLQPLPYAEPHRLVLLWGSSPSVPLDALTPGSFYEFRQRLTGVTSLAGVSNISVVMTGRGPAARVPAMSTSIDFFEVLGVHAMAGRTFDRRDGVAPRVTVLSHRFWMREFGGRSDAVGQVVTLRGIPYTIVGVMADTFVMPSIATRPGAGPGPELWIPGDAHEIPRGASEDASDARENWRAGYVRAIGRLRPGVDAAALQSEASAVAADLARRFPATNTGDGAAVVPFDAHLRRGVRTPLFVLSAAVVLVLLIACANIAGLLLGRGAARQKEMATRVALGASRARLVRQLLTENVVLAFVAGSAGLVVGWLVLGGLVALAPATLLRLGQASMDTRSLAFGMALSILATMVFGVMPALQASRVAPQGALAAATGRMTEARSRLRARRLLVAGEIALAYVLLVSALLVGRSLLKLVQTDVGYDPRQVLAFEVALDGPLGQSADRQRQLYDGILSGLRALPGVTHAGAVVNLPVGGDDFGTSVIPEGGPAVAPGDEPRVGYEIASAGYFETLRIPLLEGRDFSSADLSSADPVVIVSASLAHRYWPDQSAVGRRVRVGSRDARWSTIVGVAGDVRHGGPAATPTQHVYVPLTQRSFQFMSFVARTSRDPMTLEPAVRAVVADVAPGVPVAGASSLEARLGTSMSDTRFLTVLLVSFAAVAGLLAFVGTYGVVALAAMGRQREMSLRLALGATRRQAAGPVVRSGLGVAAAGLAAGLVLSLGASQVVERLLFDSSAADAAALLIAAGVVSAAAAVATLVPATRSVSVPPAAVLKAE